MYFHLGRGGDLPGKAIGRHENSAAAGRRSDDDGAALRTNPYFTAPRCVDDLDSPIFTAAQRRNLDNRQLHAVDLASWAGAFANLDGVKTRIQGHKAGVCRRIV